MLKNIVGGVITTVLATVLLWVFGFQERKKDTPPAPAVASSTTETTAPAALVTTTQTKTPDVEPEPEPARAPAPAAPTPFQVRLYERLDSDLVREDVSVNLGGIVQGMTLTPERPCQYLLFTAPAEGPYMYTIGVTTYQLNMYQQVYTTVGQNTGWINASADAPLLWVSFGAPNMYGVRPVQIAPIEKPPC